MKDGSTGTRVGKVLFDIDEGEEATFVTGIGIPGRSKNKPKQMPNDRDLFMSEEDKLLDSVNQTEKDMKDMMKYLDAVEKSVSGDDLEQIRRMLKYTSKSVMHHSKAYTNIRGEVELMNKNASDALSHVSRHNSDVQRMLLESEQSRRRNGTKVAIIEENNEEDDDATAYQES